MRLDSSARDEDAVPGRMPCRTANGRRWVGWLAWVLTILGVGIAGLWAWSGFHLDEFGYERVRVAWSRGTLGVEVLSARRDAESIERIVGRAILYGYEPEPHWRLGRESSPRGWYGWCVWYGWGAGMDTTVPIRRHRALGVVYVTSTDRREPPRYWSVAVVLWPWPLVCWGIGVPIIVRRGRRARRLARGECLACGYDLAGTGGGVCPECGASVTRANGHVEVSR